MSDLLIALLSGGGLIITAIIAIFFKSTSDSNKITNAIKQLGSSEKTKEDIVNTTNNLDTHINDIKETNANNNIIIDNAKETSKQADTIVLSAKDVADKNQNNISDKRKELSDRRKELELRRQNLKNK